MIITILFWGLWFIAGAMIAIGFMRRIADIKLRVLDIAVIVMCGLGGPLALVALVWVGIMWGLTKALERAITSDIVIFKKKRGK